MDGWKSRSKVDWCPKCNGTGGDMINSCRHCNGRGFMIKYNQKINYKKTLHNQKGCGNIKE